MKPCPTCFEGKQDGRVVMVICMNGEHPNFKKLVTPEICESCLATGTPSERPQGVHTQPLGNTSDEADSAAGTSQAGSHGMSESHGRPRFLSDGTIAYPKRGWEPPPVPAGYRRKSANLQSADAWVMLPVMTPCEHRSTSTAYGPCGACKISYFCKGQRIHDLSICTRCPAM